MREAMLLGFTGVEEAKLQPDFDKIRKNPKLATKLNQAMFEPDNLFKLTKVESGGEEIRHGNQRNGTEPERQRESRV